ncbi:MAG: SDR family NAD(P)-dependent oxidoreductase [Methyloligellaceae bacterium]
MTAGWKLAWVTGASSGIGRELAVRLADRSSHVAVSARSTASLDALAAGSGSISSFPADVTDADLVEKTVDEIERAHGPIDLAVLNAGFWELVSAETFDTHLIRKTMDVNYMGVVHCLAALLPRMIARRAGQIVIVSSVAGYRGLPGSAAYGPSKAALINLAESLRPELQASNVHLQLVNPGFVETPMTAKNTFTMPMIMSVDNAAERLLQGLARDKFEITFPRRFTFLMKMIRLLPYPLFFWLVRRFVLHRP